MTTKELTLTDLSLEEFKSEFRDAREALTDAQELLFHAEGTGNVRYISEASEELCVAQDAIKKFRKERARRFVEKINRR